MSRKYDIMFGALLFLVATLLIIPTTHHAFFGFTSEHYLFGGFIKFFLFASLGDVLSMRIRYRRYRVPGLFRKMFIWGVIGIFVVIVFRIFPAGVDALQREEVLPFEGNMVMNALFISILMNLFFAPTMMLFHRITDQAIELEAETGGYDLNATLRTIDYPAFIRMLMKTIPFFWIPAHTVTFLLSPMYRAFFASLLGVMLGLFLNLYKKRM